MSEKDDRRQIKDKRCLPSVVCHLLSVVFYLLSLAL